MHSSVTIKTPIMPMLWKIYFLYQGKGTKQVKQKSTKKTVHFSNTMCTYIDKHTNGLLISPCI